MKTHTKTYVFNKEKLDFEVTNVLLKYKVFLTVLLILFGATLTSAVSFKKEIAEKERIIKEKEEKIRLVKEPLRKEYYIQDLYNAIGFKLNKKQFNTFSELALKYRDQIEEAKVPATLVWYIAYKESRFDVNAKNSNSSASGLFQVIDNTWNGVCKMKGYSLDGRFNEQKQVTVVLDYLNYLYEKNGSWKDTMKAYGGNKFHYPVLFLFK